MGALRKSSRSLSHLLMSSCINSTRKKIARKKSNFAHNRYIAPQLLTLSFKFVFCF